jgi:hypothetical protein
MVWSLINASNCYMKTKLYSRFYPKLIFSISCFILFKSSPLPAQSADELITRVSVINGKTYIVNRLNTGVKQLIDRSYTITSVPEYLKGASFIQTANNDKLNTADNFLSFIVTDDVVLYIAYDPRATTIPQWLTRWTKTNDKIGTSDADVAYLEIYHRVVRNEERFEPVILGGNLASPAVGANTNYLIAAVRRPSFEPLQAEDAVLSGAVVANNHANFNGTGFADFINPSNDYIEWTVQVNVPGTYNLGFTYANASTKDRSLQITYNGTSAGMATFSHPSSSWSAWAFLQGPDIFLSPGTHKIRATATGTSGPNIDQLSLVYLDTYPPATIAINSLGRDQFLYSSSARSCSTNNNSFLQSHF